MVFLGFDFGLKRIGVAVGQSVTRSANPLPMLQVKEGVPDWGAVESLIQAWQPQGLVVGVPVALDDAPLSVTEAAKAFAETLRQRFNIPVHEADERLTTVEARAQIFEQGGYKALQDTEIDSTAAKLILETWLQLRTD